MIGVQATHDFEGAGNDGGQLVGHLDGLGSTNGPARATPAVVTARSQTVRTIGADHGGQVRCGRVARGATWRSLTKALMGSYQDI